MNDKNHIGLDEFIEMNLCCVATLIELGRYGFRWPYASLANHTLETIDNAYGDTPGLRDQVNALRGELVEMLIRPPEPQPMPLWKIAGHTFPPHHPPTPSDEPNVGLEQASLRKLRQRRVTGEQAEGEAM